MGRSAFAGWDIGECSGRASVRRAIVLPVFENLPVAAVGLDAAHALVEALEQQAGLWMASGKAEVELWLVNRRDRMELSLQLGVFAKQLQSRGAEGQGVVDPGALEHEKSV